VNLTRTNLTVTNATLGTNLVATVQPVNEAGESPPAGLFNVSFSFTAPNVPTPTIVAGLEPTPGLFNASVPANAVGPWIVTASISNTTTVFPTGPITGFVVAPGLCFHLF
jgi:hypothetical protein